MPDFLRRAGDLRLAAGISENKAVFVAVFLQPQIDIVGGTVQIHREAKLVFAVSRNGDPLFGQFFRLVFRIALTAVFGNSVFIKLPLFFLGTLVLSAASAWILRRTAILRDYVL